MLSPPLINFKFLKGKHSTLNSKLFNRYVLYNLIYFRVRDEKEKLKTKAPQYCL